MLSGTPRRLAEEEVRVAQSRGEWPGVSWTFFEGFAGTLLCDGGGARPDDGADSPPPGGPRLGMGARRDEGEGPLMERRGGWRATGARLGGALCTPAPLPARWAELRAGKEGRSSRWGRVGGAGLEVGAWRDGGGAAAEGARIAGGGGMAIRSTSAFEPRCLTSPFAGLGSSLAVVLVCATLSSFVISFSSASTFF